MIYPESYETFLQACQDIQRRRERAAKPALNALLLPRVGPEASNVELLGHIIAEALLRRIDRNLVESKNIYLETFDIPQIELFASLGAAVPLVPASHSIANQYLCQVLRERAEGSLFEIGVGRAIQLTAFLRMLQANPGKLERLRIVSLDPDPSNLATAEASVAALRPKLPFEVELNSVEGLLENFDDARLHSLASWLGPGTTVNTSFTFHHTMHPLNDSEFRTRLLTRLERFFRPSVFTLIEPHANHDTEALARRFHEAWGHFGTVFDLIDRSSVQADHRFVIKEKFFGRELRDIFGTSDMFRCERHENYEQWLFRLAKAGFEPFAQREPVRIDLPDYCYSRASEGIVRIGYSETPVVAIMASQSSAGGGDSR